MKTPPPRLPPFAYLEDKPTASFDHQFCWSERRLRSTKYGVRAQGGWFPVLLEPTPSSKAIELISRRLGGMRLLLRPRLLLRLRLLLPLLWRLPLPLFFPLLLPRLLPLFLSRFSLAYVERLSS